MRTTWFARGIGFLLLIWGALFFGSFLSFFLISPTGDGFTRGLNRVVVFLAAQTTALIVGVLVRRLTHSRTRLVSERVYFLSRLPVMAAVVEVALFTLVLLVFWAVE